MFVLGDKFSVFQQPLIAYITSSSGGELNAVVFRYIYIVVYHQNASFFKTEIPCLLNSNSP